jgi:hypothetical protein
MAHIQEQTVTIRLSKLVKANSKTGDRDLTPKDFAETLEALVGELVGDDSVIVEIDADEAD